MLSSIPAEYQARCRVNIDVADRDPLHLDIVQASIGLYTPVAPEVTILPLIIAAPFICQSSVVHPWFIPGSFLLLLFLSLLI